MNDWLFRNTYLLRQPVTLETLAINKLGEWISLQGARIIEHQQRDALRAEELITRQIEIIRHQLKHDLPHKYLDKLAEILSLPIGLDIALLNGYQRRAIGRMIETIFTNKVTRLCIGSVGLFVTLASKAQMLSNLQYLTLSLRECNSIKPEDAACMEDYAIQLLKELHNLKYFECLFPDQFGCVDYILHCIAENCKKIEGLKLLNLRVGSFNENSINIIPLLHNLRTVHIYTTAISEEGIAMLLMSCENIEDINVSNSNEMALALNLVASTEANAKKTFKLKSYDNDDETTLKELQVVVDMCPLIEKMSLRKNDEPSNYLTPLKDLQYLHDLALEDYDFYTDQIKELLEVKGCDLTHLELEGVLNVDLKALICINVTCPYLQKLSLFRCTYVKQKYDSYFDINYESKSWSFSNLKTLSLTAEPPDLGGCQPSIEQLQFLLSNCPNVECIETHRVSLSNEILLSVMERNKLVYLKELKLYHHHRPSQVVVNKIIENCINHPIVVWDNMD